MKELICFAIGVVVGMAMSKHSQTIDELRKELDREKCFNRLASNASPS